VTEEPTVKPADPRILTINGGSSSIKFALFEVGGSLRRVLGGEIERIALPEATLRVKGENPADGLAAVGHRVVHGGPKYGLAQHVTADTVAELRRLSAFDPEQAWSVAEALRALVMTAPPSTH
jgi:acetate kinase